MPSWIKQYQDANAELALKLQGLTRRTPIVRVGQYGNGGSQAHAIKLPHGEVPQLQVMTLGSDYGKFYFLADYSTVDGGDIIN